MVNGERIKILMNERGITNRQMCEIAGLSDAMMSYVIRELREPNITALKRIAVALDCTVDELIRI